MKMKFSKRSYGLFLTIALLSLSQIASAATLSMKVKTVSASGDRIVVPILTDTCEGLGALQFSLSFDQNVVAVVSVEAGAALSNGMVEFNLDTPGQVGIALASNEPITETGELLTVEFKTLNPKGGKTEVKINRPAAWDHKNNLEMLVTTEDGSLNVSPSRELIPEKLKLPLLIGGGVLFVLILIILIARRAKKSPQAAPVATSGPGGAAGGFCQKCGAPHDAVARFCPKCGQALS
jgi:hypothetical protein